MPFIKTYPLSNSAILRLNSERDRIDVEPEYQRRGEVWTKEKRQLLIDSILNDYDIPKLYFHALTDKSRERRKYDYSIIDGRQRLEAIWTFADDEFSLAPDFSYLDDANVEAAGMTYSELSSAYPKLKIRFDSFSLPIVCVETDDLDLIEDMFSRLNEAVPLNAAEKRNAMGGPMAECIRQVSLHHFFSDRVSFTDRRYQHREVAARLLFLEYTLLNSNKIIDTKKPYLDAMVKKYKDYNEPDLSEVRSRTIRVLNHLDAVFSDKDSLLRAQGIIPVYYLTIKAASQYGTQNQFTRSKIEEFQLKLAENRKVASDDIASAEFDLLEFDRLSQQGTNDSASIREKVRILGEAIGIFPAGVIE